MDGYSTCAREILSPLARSAGFFICVTNSKGKTADDGRWIDAHRQPSHEHLRRAECPRRAAPWHARRLQKNMTFAIISPHFRHLILPTEIPNVTATGTWQDGRAIHMQQSESENVDRAIGLRLRSRRMAVGKSQTDLAKATGISYQQVQKYETGVNRITPGRLVTFARLLGVSPHYFFDPAETGESPISKDAQPDPMLLRDAAIMNRLVPLIPDQRVRRALIQVIEAVSRDNS